MSRSILLIVVLLLLPLGAFAQSQNNVRAMSGVGMGARALGMGGAFTAVADGPTAMYWNPAGLACSRGFKSDFSLIGQVDNFDVLGDAADVLDAIRSDDLTPDEFDDLWDAAGTLAGRPASLEASSDLIFSLNNFAVGVYGQAAGDAELTRNPNVGTFDPTAPASVLVDGSALSYWAAGVGYGRFLKPNLAAGITVKEIHVRRAVANYQAAFDPANADDPYTSVDNNETSDDSSEISADLGLIWWPQPEIYNNRLRLALMVRNVNSPEFDVSLPTVDNLTDLRFNPVVNLGVAVNSTDGRTLFAADLRNVTTSNDAKALLCLGVEHELTSWLTLRLGLYDGEVTKGLGLKLGPVNVSAAMGAHWDDLVAFSFATDF